MKSLPSIIRYSMVLITLLGFLFTSASCEPPDEIPSTPSVPSTETSPTEIPSSTTGATTSTPTPSPIVSPGVNKWDLVDILHGYKGTPSDKFFNASIEVQSIDSVGGELLIKMNPVVDPECVQIFRVGWEFIAQSILTVYEGDEILIDVFNSGILSDCYEEAKNAMSYRGEVVIDLGPPGSSHWASRGVMAGSRGSRPGIPAEGP